MKKLLVLLLCLCIALPCALSEDTITYENGNMVQYITRDDGSVTKIIYYANPNAEGLNVIEEIVNNGERRSVSYQNDSGTVRWEYYENGILTTKRYYTEESIIRVDAYDETGALKHYELVGVEITEDGYTVNKRYLPDGSQDHEWWWSADHDLYHEIWFVDGKVDSYTYWYYNTDEAYEIYEEYDTDGTLTKRHLYNENGERIDNKEPVEFAEKSYVDEDKNFIQEYYDDDHQAWCRYTRFKKPNEEGQVVVTLTNMETGLPITEIWYSDYMNSVRSRVYLYREDGVLAEARYYNEDGSTAAEVYDETGAVLYKDVTYAEPNAEGYEVTQRFLPDGTIDHEWWWGEIDLYHEIWYVDGQVEFYTYWWYNIDGHDVKYEEHCKQYSKYCYYDYDANGELQMTEGKTVHH